MLVGRIDFYGEPHLVRKRWVSRYELHRLLGTLLSSGLNETEKLDILEREYPSGDLRAAVGMQDAGRTDPDGIR